MKKSLKASYTVEASMVMPLVLFLSFRDLHSGSPYVRKFKRHRFTLHDYRNYRVRIFLKEAKC